MTRLRLSLLGVFEVRLEPGSPLTFRTQKAQALLAYLALPLGQAHRRDKLAALLWEGMRDEQARTSLRQALYDLRKHLGSAAPAALRAEGETVALDPAAIDLDVATFARLVGEGTPEALERAALLYRGDLLEGFSVNEEPFDGWLMEERERLRELARPSSGSSRSSEGDGHRTAGPAGLGRHRGESVHDRRDDARAAGRRP
jgi:DNA-binding SARP family transcriptional activator